MAVGKSRDQQQLLLFIFMAVLGNARDQQSGIKKKESDTDMDYQREQRLRFAVLGANNGLVSTASLMMGVGALKDDRKAMILSGFAGLVAGAFSIAMREFISVYSLDIEEARIKRDREMKEGSSKSGEIKGGLKSPSALQAAATSALSFSLGAILPILAAAFIKPHKLRLGVVVGTVTLALMVFGGLGRKLGRSGVSMFLGGWVAILLTFGLMKLYGYYVI